ncbi:MAG: (d)CMP kinase [Candidatus Kapabacteria bacterium]|nr:(d)CMP kinase [Ignavibacteriota bacterium]MCW5884790.1 (d)CMP kinase [Candidatus Kapabacteria bacterium]
MMKKIIIAIDGPAGSGKSTTAKIVAEKLGYIYIDTGAMYRAVTLACIEANTDINDESVSKVVDDIIIELRQSDLGQRTILDGRDVSDDIRRPDVTKLVSPVSAMAYVREKMVEQQRLMGQSGGVVMDGRDIGTVVFTQAELKIYLIASIEARAERRMKELKLKGYDSSIDEISSQIEARDKYDSSREISPLKKADDAIEIDTSNITIEEQTSIILNLANDLLKVG